MRKFFKDLIQFVKGVSADPRIPERDKAVLAALLGLLVSPFDIIPDFIPVLGQLDDFVILAMILDYLFETLDSDILLSHFPWGMKRFIFIRNISRTMNWFVPGPLKQRLWKYSGSPYKR